MPPAHTLVGDVVGTEGDDVGDVGDSVGLGVGDAVGDRDGDALGLVLGLVLGWALGLVLGDSDGLLLGTGVGYAVGESVGIGVGDAVGALVGHGSVAQACVALSGHALPPQLGSGFVHARVLVPPPQGAEHEPQAPHWPWTVPQERVSEPPPAQPAPPQLGAGLSQLRARVCWHVVQAVYAPHNDQPPFTAQHCVLHAWEAGPEHAAPLCCGAGLLQRRVCVPLPHGFEQSPQSLHPPATGHGPAAQACVLLPGHALPPRAGAGFVHVRVCTPLPHVAEQPPKALQPPCTGHADRTSARMDTHPTHDCGMILTYLALGTGVEKSCTASNPAVVVHTR